MLRGGLSGSPSACHLWSICSHRNYSLDCSRRFQRASQTFKQALKFGPRLPLRGHIAGLLQNWWIREYAPFLSTQREVCYAEFIAALFFGFPGVKSSNFSPAVRGKTSDGLDEGFLADTHTDVLRVEAIPTKKRFHCPKRALYAARGAARRRSSRVNSGATTFLCAIVDGRHRIEAL